MSEKGTNVMGCLMYLALFCVLLCACGVISFTDCEHRWQPATCTEPMTCADCGETEGEPLGHQWTAATCTEPEQCSVCGVHRHWYSVSLGHDWQSATCTTPKTCARCGATEGEAYGHDYYFFTSLEPTCQEEGERTNKCSRCGDSYTESLPAIDCIPGEWEDVEDECTSTLYVKARYCTMCGREMDRKQVTLSAGTTSAGSGGGTVYDNQGQQNTTATYVLNTSTMKFHRPSCRDVPRIAAKNYATSSQSRDYLISIGYSPCGHCSP